MLVFDEVLSFLNAIDVLNFYDGLKSDGLQQVHGWHLLNNQQQLDDDLFLLSLLC